MTTVVMDALVSWVPDSISLPASRRDGVPELTSEKLALIAGSSFVAGLNHFTADVVKGQAVGGITTAIEAAM